MSSAPVDSLAGVLTPAAWTLIRPRERKPGAAVSELVEDVSESGGRPATAVGVGGRPGPPVPYVSIDLHVRYNPSASCAAPRMSDSQRSYSPGSIIASTVLYLMNAVCPAAMWLST